MYYFYRRKLFDIFRQKTFVDGAFADENFANGIIFYQ